MSDRTRQPHPSTAATAPEGITGHPSTTAQLSLDGSCWKLTGRAGTTAGITARTIAVLQEKFDIAPADLVVEISPCIRPPLYETDFAAEIAAQAREAGAGQIIDAGICTGREVGHYYSYRVERGRTGRMLAALQMLS
jgi:copper oxidase (laccase) domain-containing protein